jgi:hypothetical protein
LYVKFVFAIGSLSAEVANVLLVTFRHEQSAELALSGSAQNVFLVLSQKLGVTFSLDLINWHACVQDRAKGLLSHPVHESVSICATGLHWYVSVAVTRFAHTSVTNFLANLTSSPALVEHDVEHNWPPVFVACSVQTGWSLGQPCDVNSQQFSNTGRTRHAPNVFKTKLNCADAAISTGKYAKLGGLLKY